MTMFTTIILKEFVNESSVGHQTTYLNTPGNSSQSKLNQTNKIVELKQEFPETDLST